MPNIPNLEEMLKAGVHFGHRTSRWHPKMKPYIFGVRSGIHVIDVEQTQKKLEEALGFIENLVSRGGNVIFIGTKKQIVDLVKETADSCQMPFINNRWLGGTFTNFGEIQKLIRTYLGMIDKRDKGELKKYTKLEQLQFDRKIEDLYEKIGGISTLKKLPEAIFVFDVRNEKTAIYEARKRGVKIIAVCDTNVNPVNVDYVIPANDDSIASLELIGKLAAAAVLDGKKAPVQAQPKVEEKKEEAPKEELSVTKASQETVEDLDDELKDKLAREKEETIKK